MTLTDKVLVDLENVQTGNIYTIFLTPDEIQRLECTFSGKNQEIIKQKKITFNCNIYLNSTNGIFVLTVNKYLF